MRSEVLVVIDLRADHRPPLLDTIVSIDRPHLVNGRIHIPSSRMSLGNDHHISRSEEVLRAIGIAQHAVSLQHVKHLRDGLAVGGLPSALGAVPRPSPEGAVVGELPAPILGRAPIVRCAGSLRGEVWECEVVEGDVAESRGLCRGGGCGSGDGWRIGRMLLLAARQTVQVGCQRDRGAYPRRGCVRRREGGDEGGEGREPSDSDHGDGAVRDCCSARCCCCCCC
mmetsp:Transcript_38987/g.93835  ORF Transcript_38987/g.93835 Transcript_38987/m.93835 type:complete len:225 (+) Transcript_38987:717-1391(+)